MPIIELDNLAVAYYINIPGSKVALLQSLFESYEGIGTVRTIDIKKSLVAILSTKDQIKICLEVLESVKSELSWTEVEQVTSEMTNESAFFKK